jgi:hypothetical protein
MQPWHESGKNRGTLLQLGKLWIGVQKGSWTGVPMPLPPSKRTGRIRPLCLTKVCLFTSVRLLLDLRACPNSKEPSPTMNGRLFQAAPFRRECSSFTAATLAKRRGGTSVFRCSCAKSQSAAKWSKPCVKLVPTSIERSDFDAVSRIDGDKLPLHQESPIHWCKRCYHQLKRR